MINETQSFTYRSQKFKTRSHFCNLKAFLTAAVFRLRSAEPVFRGRLSEIPQAHFPYSEWVNIVLIILNCINDFLHIVTARTS